MFSCAVVGIVVRMKDGTCQIVVEKKKKETVGEQLLTPSKIVPSELKPFEGDTLYFSTTHDIPLRMFPLQSERETCVAVKEKAGKCEMFEGRELLIHFRVIVMDIIRNLENWEVSTNYY